MFAVARHAPYSLKTYAVVLATLGGIGFVGGALANFRYATLHPEADPYRARAADLVAPPEPTDDEKQRGPERDRVAPEQPALVAGLEAPKRVPVERIDPAYPVKTQSEFVPRPVAGIDRDDEPVSTGSWADTPAIKPSDELASAERLKRPRHLERELPRVAAFVSERPPIRKEACMVPELCNDPISRLPAPPPIQLASQPPREVVVPLPPVRPSAL